MDIDLIRQFQQQNGDNDYFDEFRKKFLNKKVKLKVKAFGNSSSKYSISYQNLVPIEKEAIGTVIDCNEDIEFKTLFVTVRFPNNVFANLGLTTVELVN